MKKLSSVCCLSLLALGLPQLVQARGGFADVKSAAPDASAGPSKPDPALQSKVLANYGKIPLSFEANHGQTDSRVKFLSRGSGYTLFLTGDEAVLALKQSEVRIQKSEVDRSRPRGPGTRPVPGTKDKGQRTKDSVLTMQLAGASPDAVVSGTDQLPGKSNYFIGNDPRKWRSNVPTYAKVKYENIYPGVDLVYYGNQGQLEYDFVVAPGGAPNAIRLDVGADLSRHHKNGGVKPPLRIDANGDLVVKLDGSELRFRKPVVYQPATPNLAGPERSRGELGTEKLAVEGHYRLAGHQVKFEVGKYDHARPLVIDPALTYSTFLGGSSNDVASAVALDASGDAYVTGYTGSTDFPVTAGAFQSSGNGSDGFLTKFNPTGTALLYSTYFGGSSGGNGGSGLAVNAAGNAYIVGFTSAADYPTTPGAYQTVYGGGFYDDAVVTEFNATGSALVYSTYLGGSLEDDGYAIALSQAGNAYVTGFTQSTNFPTTLGVFQNSCSGGSSCSNAFVTEVNASGSALVYSTYLGGSSYNTASGIAADSSGNAYVTGETDSSNFPVTAGAFQTTYGGDDDSFVTKFNPSGSALVYSTYLGGNQIDQGSVVVVDSAGEAYVTGYTYSVNFPSTPGAFQTVCKTCGGGGGFTGGSAGFVTKLNPMGTALVYSTFLSGSGYAVEEGVIGDVARGLSIDATGDAYVTGGTVSSDFPTTPGSFESYSCSNPDNPCGFAYLTEFNPSGSGLVYSTYLGGGSDGGDWGTATAVNSSGDAVVVGGTESPAFPTTAGAFQTTLHGTDDAFISMFIPSPNIGLVPTSLSYSLQTVGTKSPSQTVTLTNTGNATLNVSSIGFSGTGAADFTQTNNCGTSLVVGASCTINVTFAPLMSGTLMANLSLTDNAPLSPQTVALTGTGTASGLTISPASLTFPAQVVFTTSPAQTVTLTSIGTQPLTITSIATATPFAQTNTCPSSLAVGSSCTMSVTFDPTAGGTAVGSLTISDNAPGTPQIVALSGTGTDLQVSPSSLNFGNFGIGTASPPQAISVANKATTTVSITSIAVTGTNPGDFAQTNNCGSNVTPGEICTIDVTFTPTAQGTRTAAVSITSNGGGSPQTVTLSGTGGQNNSVPAITQPLIPATAAPAGNGFTLNVNGGGFISTSTVNWNGSPRTTTFVSSRQLTASILASDIATAGTARVTVTNPAPGGGTSNVVYFPITTSTTGLFFSESTLTTGTTPKELVAADFNGDGKADLAIANGKSNTVSVYLGNGNGTFGSRTDFAVGVSPRSVIVGDFNGDGKLDLAVSNSGANTVSILLGNGNGTFQSHVDYATGTTPTVMALGDFNDDGKLDLAVANFNSDTVSVLLGNGDGTLQTHVDYTAGTGAGSLTAGDFNGDGKLDLACGNFSANTVSILLGNADGTFQTHVDYGTGVGPSAVITADFNSDGKLDLALTNLTSNTLSILLGNGNGTFQTHVDYATSTGPQDLATSDLNGDGILDLEVANSKASSFSTLPGNGNGTFQGRVDTVAGSGPDSVALADFNGDGRLDVAISNGSASTVLIALQSPDVGLSTGGLNFGSVNLGSTSAAQNVTLTNIGSAPLAISSISITGTNSGDYAETNTCPASLAGGAACSVSVTFTPKATGSRSASLSIADNAAGSPQTVSLSGTGVGTPVVKLSATSLTFATQLVATSSASKPVTLTNTGNGTLTITSIAVTGSNSTDYSETNTCGSSVAAGANCTINVTFKPTAKGSRSASVSITDNAAGSPQKVSLTGTGTVVKLSPTSLNFGSVQVGHKSAAESVTVTNTGSSSLSVTNIGITGTNAGDFSETNTCGSSLGGGKSCSISVTFTPRAKGNRTASLSITDNGGGSPQTVSLSGTGT